MSSMPTYSKKIVLLLVHMFLSFYDEIVWEIVVIDHIPCRTFFSVMFDQFVRFECPLLVCGDKLIELTLGNCQKSSMGLLKYLSTRGQF